MLEMFQQSYWAVLSDGTIYCAVRRRSVLQNFQFVDEILHCYAEHDTRRFVFEEEIYILSFLRKLRQTTLGAKIWNCYD